MDDLFGDIGPASTAQSAAMPNLFDDVPVTKKKFDWSNVKTSADVQKVLDAQPTRELKKAALSDWASNQVAKEAAGGFVPHAMPSAHVLGAGLIDDLDAGLNAGVSYLTGGKHGNTFEQEKALQKARENYVAENSSPLAKGAAMAGGLAVSARLPMATPFSEASLLGRTGNAVVTGAGYGGIEGATHGDTLGERAVNTAEGVGIGAATGGVLEPVATGIGNVVRSVGDRVRGLPPELQGMGRGAVNRVGRAITDDDIAQTYLGQRHELGPQGMLADMGPNLRDQAGAIANRPGAGQRILREALDDRNELAPARISQDIEAAFGPEQNLVQLERNTVNGANAAAGPHYDQFYNTDIVPTARIQAVMGRLGADPRIAADAERLAGLEGHPLMRQPRDAAGNPIGDPVPTARAYDYYHRAINDQIAQVGGPNTELGRAYSMLDAELRGAVDHAISPQNPAAGPWSQARAVSGTGQQFREGLSEGSGVFTRPKTHNPDVVADNLAQGSPSYGAGFRAGARGDLANMANDAATQFGPSGDRALRKGMFSENAERKIHQLASSPQAAQRVIQRRNAESTFAETRNHVLSNSATARRQAAQKEFPAPAEITNSPNRFGETLTGLAVGAGRHLVNAATLGRYNQHLTQMAENAARILSATGQDRDQFFFGLMRHLQAQGANAAQAQAVAEAVRGLLPPATAALTREATASP